MAERRTLSSQGSERAEAEGSSAECLSCFLGPVTHSERRRRMSPAATTPRSRLSLEAVESMLIWLIVSWAPRGTAPTPFSAGNSSSPPGHHTESS